MRLFPQETSSSIRRFLIYFGVIGILVGGFRLAYGHALADHVLAALPVVFSVAYIYCAVTLPGALERGATFLKLTLWAGLVVGLANSAQDLLAGGGLRTLVTGTLVLAFRVYLIVNVQRLVREARVSSSSLAA